MVALTAEGLVFDYPGGRRAVHGVSLRLEPGELLCVVGPNGSGKSTLLRLCAGLLTPKAGLLRLDGRPLGSWAPRARARELAFVPQGLQGLPDLDARGFVMGGRYPHHPRWAGLVARATRADRLAVERALEEADVLDLADRRLDELSSGQLQRVRLARALAQEAPLLFFDEPTAALDPEHQIRLFLSIERLLAGGRAAMVATHELSLASRFARHALVLRAGQAAAQGTSAEIFRPAVLEPVFGPHLHFGALPPGGSSGATALVVPWPREGLRPGSGGATMPGDMPVERQGEPGR